MPMPTRRRSWMSSDDHGPSVDAAPPATDPASTFPADGPGLSTIPATVEKLVDNPVDAAIVAGGDWAGTDGAGTLTPGPSRVTRLARRSGRPDRDQTGSGRLKGRWCAGPHHVEGGRDRGPGPGARGAPARRGSAALAAVSARAGLDGSRIGAGDGPRHAAAAADGSGHLSSA
jgi:hypothetical protein